MKSTVVHAKDLAMHVCLFAYDGRGYNKLPAFDDLAYRGKTSAH